MFRRRPAWHRSARQIGGIAWVPFEIADALDTQVEELQGAVAVLETELREMREAAQREAERAAPAPAPAPIPEGDSPLLQLKRDLRTVLRNRDLEIERARLAERVERLRGVGELHDVLQRALAALPDGDPHRVDLEAIAGLAGAELTRAGARLFGAPGEPFDPTLHEALGTAPAGECRADTVVHVERAGLQLADGTLVRPARVIVAVDTPGHP